MKVNQVLRTQLLEVKQLSQNYSQIYQQKSTSLNNEILELQKKNKKLLDLNEALNLEKDKEQQIIKNHVRERDQKEAIIKQQQEQYKNINLQLQEKITGLEQTIQYNQNMINAKNTENKRLQQENQLLNKQVLIQAQDHNSLQLEKSTKNMLLDKSDKQQLLYVKTQLLNSYNQLQNSYNQLKSQQQLEFIQFKTQGQLELIELNQTQKIQSTNHILKDIIFINILISAILVFKFYIKCCIKRRS